MSTNSKQVSKSDDLVSEAKKLTKEDESLIKLHTSKDFI
jgi:hypothetical protein